MRAFKSNLVARVGEARQFFAASAPAFLFVPPARWPLAWHAAVALCAVAALAAAGYFWRNARLHGNERAVVELQQLNAQFATLKQQRPASDTPSPPLADARFIDDVVRDMGQFAATRSMRVASVRIEHDSAQTAAALQVRLVTQVFGDYAAIKSWLSEMLARYPSLAISTLDIRRTAPDQPQLEASITYTLFTRPTR